MMMILFTNAHQPCLQFHNSPKGGNIFHRNISLPLHRIWNRVSLFFPFAEKHTHWRRQMLHRESKSKYLHRLIQITPVKIYYYFSFNCKLYLGNPVTTTKSSLLLTHTMGQWVFQIYDTKRNEGQDNRNYTQSWEDD